MPIYEYKCNKCGCIFEELIFRSDCMDQLDCPSCGDGDTCRLMSSFACGSSSGSRDLGGGLPSSCPSSSGGFS